MPFAVDLEAMRVGFGHGALLYSREAVVILFFHQPMLRTPAAPYTDLVALQSRYVLKARKPLNEN